MAEEKKICASCGSPQPLDATICDICGHDLTVVEAPVPTPPAAAEPSPAQRPAPQQKKKSGAKGSPRKPAPAGTPLFSTMQWLAITVASFILGGVITASFLPQQGTDSAAGSDNATMTQGSQPDLQTLNAAKAAVDANPEDPGTILIYANALHDAGMEEQAIVQYKSYLSKNPDDPDARVDLGICYFNLQEYDAAIAEMERAVTAHPEHQLGTYNLGIVYLNAGNKEKAREWFTRARDMDPESAHGRNAAQLLREHF